MSQRVWIAQCLCPDRHCIVAGAGEAADSRKAAKQILEPLKADVANALRLEVISPWCSLCNAKSDTWRYELRRSAFRTMDDARPVLERLQAEQMVANALFGDMPMEKPN
jgi:hypothetical protein